MAAYPLASTEPATAPHTRRFVKMHGLGNDFVVFDARNEKLTLSDAQVRAIADRRTGVGCDQLIVIEPAKGAAGASVGSANVADAFMRIHNADGGEVEACGNGARCVADLIMRASQRDHLLIETVVGLLDAHRASRDRVAIDMGLVRLDWREIPLATPQDTLHVDLTLGVLSDPVAVNVGNPHAVFFVADAERIDLASLGPVLERHKLFPDRANIEVAQMLTPERIRMRVWERGVGITRACGTGACATLVAASRRGYAGRKATIVLDGGELEIEWLKDGHILMTGPVAVSFTGELALP